MEYLSLPRGAPVKKLGVLPGSFHPITRAHMALAEAALSQVDQVLFVMPREQPHKSYQGVGLAERIAMVRRAVEGGDRYAVGLSDGGLFIDIARELRPHYGYSCDLWFLCGRDAAERIVEWDYGAEGRFAEQLSEFGLLVAGRNGREYFPPEEYEERIRPLSVGEQWTDLSATEIRRRIQSGVEWAHLVPQQVVAEVQRLYS